MSRYLVTYTYTADGFIGVDANTLEEALDKVEQTLKERYGTEYTLRTVEYDR